MPHVRPAATRALALGVLWRSHGRPAGTRTSPLWVYMPYGASAGSAAPGDPHAG